MLSSLNLKKMVSELKSRITSAIIILAALVLLFSLPNLLVGHAVGEQYSDISGRWNASQAFFFDEEICKKSPLASSDGVTFLLTLTQEGKQLKAESSSFNVGSNVFSNTYYSMGFATPESLNGNAQYVMGPGVLNISFSNIKVLDDCNSMVGDARFILYDKNRERAPCTGNGRFLATRMIPSGCGIKCIENWSCSDWGECKNSTQARSCFDNNSCKNESTRPAESQSCEMPIVTLAPVPKSNESLWIYIIIILAILIAITGTKLLKMQLKKRKENMLQDLKKGIENINSAMSGGDKMEAMNQYRIFGEKFSKYKPFIKEEDYNRLYDDVLKAYNRILQSNSQF